MTTEPRQPATAADRTKQTEFALGSYAHGLTPSKTFNAQQFEDWKRLLAEYRAAIEAEARASDDSLRAALEDALSTLRAAGRSFYQVKDPCSDPTGTNELDAADMADDIMEQLPNRFRAALAASAEPASERSPDVVEAQALLDGWHDEVNAPGLSAREWDRLVEEAEEARPPVAGPDAGERE